MDVQTWLKQPGHSKRGLARAAGVTWRVIHKIAAGHVPLVETARKIEAATDGQVTAAEILGVDASAGEAA